MNLATIVVAAAGVMARAEVIVVVPLEVVIVLVKAVLEDQISLCYGTFFYYGTHLFVHGRKMHLHGNSPLIEFLHGVNWNSFDFGECILKERNV